jgi:energy-converting hydrogenase Eha subunit C
VLNKLSAFGLILLLVGVICLVVGSYNLSIVNVVQLDRFESLWSGSVNLTRGNTYGIDIQGSEDWGKFFANSTFTQPMPVNISIMSPEGDTTCLQAYFYGLDPDSRYLTVSPAIVDVKYQNADKAALAIDYSTPRIRFMAKQDGSYNATVPQRGFYGSTQPPDYITFLEEVTPNRETYSLVAMAGGVFCAVGGIGFIVGLFRNRNVKHKGRK